MIGLTFDRYARLTAALSPHWRAAIHAHLPESVQAQGWRELRERAWREREYSAADVLTLPPIPSLEDRRAA